MASNNNDMAEQFQRSAQYVDAYYECWKTVFDSYDQLLRTLRSLLVFQTEEQSRLLNDFKKQFELKQEEMEILLSSNLEKLKHGVNVLDTPPVACRIDFSLAKLIRAVWPTTATASATASTTSPAKAAAAAAAAAASQGQIQPPPGFDNKQQFQIPDNSRVLSWVQNVSHAPPPVSADRNPAGAPSSLPMMTTAMVNVDGIDDNDNDDEFETFGPAEDNFTAGRVAPGLRMEQEQLSRPNHRHLSDLDDYDTFGEEIIGQTSATSAAAIDRLASSSSAATYQHHGGNMAEDLENLRCVHFLAEKMKQKYGEMREAALSKVYGHLSEQEAYRRLIGGLKDFPAFLEKFPLYFKLNATRQSVALAQDACRRAGEALRSAEKKASEASKQKQQHSSKKQQSSKQSVNNNNNNNSNNFRNAEPFPANVSSSKKMASMPPAVFASTTANNAKPSLLDIDDYGSSGDSAADNSENASADEFDDYDEFGGGGGGNDWQQKVGGHHNKVRQQQQQPITVSTTTTTKPGSGLSYWDIVEFVVKQLDLARKYESYDVGKQIAVEAVKLAMQAHGASGDFGKLTHEHLINSVEPFISKGYEAVKRKQQQRAEEATMSTTLNIPTQKLNEWRLKTILCSDFAANGQCPRGLDCVFAHGQGELRPRRRCKLCSSWKAGCCRKTPDECNAAHGQEYLGTVLPGQDHLLLANVNYMQQHQQQQSSSALPASSRPTSAAAGSKASFWKPTSNMSSSLQNFSDNDPDCLICFHVMKVPSNIRLLKCGHRFHKDCLAEWLNKSDVKTCPKCRIAVVDDQEFPELRKF